MTVSSRLVSWFRFGYSSWPSWLWRDYFLARLLRRRRRISAVKASLHEPRSFTVSCSGEERRGGKRNRCWLRRQTRIKNTNKSRTTFDPILPSSIKPTTVEYHRSNDYDIEGHRSHPLLLVPSQSSIANGWPVIFRPWLVALSCKDKRRMYQKGERSEVCPNYLLL